jgi:hypothetical protein
MGGGRGDLGDADRMSWEALNWAGNQRTRSCSTQVVLYVLANAADPDGVAMDWWKGEGHWWQYLMDRTRLKRASLYRIMDELEKAGALTIEWRIPSAGEKKRAVVHLNLGSLILEDAATAESTTETHDPAETAPPEPTESTTETPAKVGVHQGDKMESTTETPIYTGTCIKIPERNPPSPPRGGFDAALEKRWQEFRAAYPDGILDLDRAKAAFAALTEPDQADALAGLAHYADRCKRRREKSMKAHLYVAKRVWVGLGAAAAPETASTRIHDPAGRAGRAVLAAHVIAGKGRPYMSKTGLLFRCELTPRLLALADAPPISAWFLHKAGTPNRGAWRSFIEEVFAGKDIPRLADISAPWEWPPLKDGTLSPTGPTESTGPPIEPRMTEDDVRELTKGFD